ncbi:MAG: hypothetical protein JJU02_02895 [Cryomorphaceae bacterium]|nr:hypothetical protein [Cryomorphaceae bacterium]
MRYYLFLLTMLVHTTFAQVDLRQLPFTPEQDEIVLDSTRFVMDVPEHINSLEVKGDFSGKIHIYGSDRVNQAEIFLVYKPFKQDQRAIGLREISVGTNDNTGVGVEVKIDEGMLQISPASERYKNKYFVIVVPARMDVKIAGTGFGGEVLIHGINGRVSTEKMQASVFLQKVRGEIYVETKQNIEVVFAEAPEESIFLKSHIGLVDVSVPANASLNVEVTNERITPRIFSDLPLEMTGEKKGWQQYTLNKGKTTISVNAPFGNVYLRSFSQSP